jgi:hypothetical protein
MGCWWTEAVAGHGRAAGTRSGEPALVVEPHLGCCGPWTRSSLESVVVDSLTPELC